MFKKALVLAGLLFPVLFFSGCSLKKAPAALQVNTEPSANVFLDGKLLGKTPYQSNDLKAGEFTIKLIPETATNPLASWEGKIKLNNGVLTLIERELGTSENTSSGQILSLEKTKDKKKASVAIVSNPDGALVHIDGEAKGFTPINLDEIGVGEHQITLAKDGYAQKSVKAKAAAGFKLILNVQLAQEGGEEPVATGSGSLTPTPTKASSDSSSTSSSSAPASGQVEIKDTPTGWLRVRAQATTSSEEIAKVNPGEKYKLLEQSSGWYKIELENGDEGWISAQYATKL